MIPRSSHRHALAMSKRTAAVQGHASLPQVKMVMWADGVTGLASPCPSTLSSFQVPLRVSFFEGFSEDRG